ELTVSGSKNAALPIFAATLLSSGVHRIRNVPALSDIQTMIKILERLGAKVELEKKNSYIIDTRKINTYTAPYELVKTMRASFLILGPLIARFGVAQVSLPGGCAIGERPVDQHLKGLQKLGAKIELKDGYVNAKAETRLVGSKIVMDLITVTGVMNIMMAATLASGKTIIENAASEPELVALANALNMAGAKIEITGHHSIVIHGVSTLKPLDVKVIPDRIEAGTFIMAVAATGGELLLKNIITSDLTSTIAKLQETGLAIEATKNQIHLKSNGRLNHADISTAPFPGFPTDLQAQYMAVAATSKGTSRITENIFENRFTHVSELRRMGADIELIGDSAIVKGRLSLSGAEVMATDLRASAALIIAGLVAKGVSTIDRIYHLDRGYENIESKLSKLGGSIERKTIKVK
ncbi:MAG: UDP-N-acetylglucosamine 1-carboxyvinyltransferase, partial [Nitrospinota bacterium]